HTEPPTALTDVGVMPEAAASGAQIRAARTAQRTSCVHRERDASRSSAGLEIGGRPCGVAGPPRRAGRTLSPRAAPPRPLCALSRPDDQRSARGRAQRHGAPAHDSRPRGGHSAVFELRRVATCSRLQSVAGRPPVRRAPGELARKARVSRNEEFAREPQGGVRLRLARRRPARWPMIIRKDPSGGLVLIGQTDHSRFVGQLAAHWGNRDFETPKPYDSVVRAATFHDYGWLRYETSPLVAPQTGEPYAFLQVPMTDTQLASYQWALDWMADIDPYSGLIVSMHRTGLWKGRYQTIKHPAGRYNLTALSPEVQAFIARNEAWQERQRATLD